MCYIHLVNEFCYTFNVRDGSEWDVQRCFIVMCIDRIRLLGVSVPFSAVPRELGFS